MTMYEDGREQTPGIFEIPPHLLNIVASGDLDLVRAVGALEMADVDVANLLASAQRFNETVHVYQEDGSVLVDDNYVLKRMLEQVPSYLTGARSAGLSEMQVNELMLHMFDTNPYDFASESNTTTLWAYGEIFRRKGEESEPITADEYQIVKELIGLSGEAGVMDKAAYAHFYASRIGLSIGQAVQMIGTLPERDGSLSGYTFSPFNQALKSLIPAEVEAATVTQVLNAIGGERPYFRQPLYRAFEELVIFGGPAEHRTTQDLLDSIKYQLDQGVSAQDAIIAIAGQRDDRALTTGVPGAEIMNPDEEITEYFILKEGELEVLGLPYRTKRSFQDGLEDLSRIARANFTHNLEIGEGMWVFDNESETWYSLGGKLELAEGRARHNFIPYDISKLSRQPLLFHVHPDAYSSMIAPTRGSGPQPEMFDRDVTAFLMATPSRADYNVAGHFVQRSTTRHESRAFIVHKLGVTEYSYPHNTDGLATMAMDARSMRDDTLIEYDWAGAIRQMLEPKELVEQLVTDLASRYPEGFTLKLLNLVDLL